MRSHISHTRRREALRKCYWLTYLVLPALLTGCLQHEQTQNAVIQEPDLAQDGRHVSGAWTYIYSITNTGTRSEGCHGVLSYDTTDLPAPMHVNDYYETPWGRLYWVGNPVVLFGAHGWMPKPLVRKPIGQALINPAIARSDRLLLHLKVLAPEELYTPDRLEKDPNVLGSLKPFGLSEAHLQYDWFPIGSDPVKLHDTKRWGMLTVCRTDLNQRVAPTLEFTCTTDLSLETTPKPSSLAELMAVPEFPDKPTRISLSPQADTLQPIQCTLSPIIGDPLVLYVICRIEDQGPDGPWKSPAGRVYESK